MRNPKDRAQQLMFQIKVLEGMHTLDEYYQGVLSRAKTELKQIEAANEKAFSDLEYLSQVHAKQRDLLREAGRVREGFE